MNSILSFILIGIYIALNADGQKNNLTSSKVEVIKDFKYLYRFENFYIGGQPTLEELQWLKSKGAKKLITFRTDKENHDFSETAFDEKSNAIKLGFEYHCIPVDGTKDYTPEKLNDFTRLLNKDETIYIHCLSAGRATYFFMAYLIRNRGYTINEAVEVGKDLRFSFPLESLLGTTIFMETDQ